MDEAQKEWKRSWRRLKYSETAQGRTYAFGGMARFRREAALERKLEAAQRTIEAQAKQISHACSLADVDNADALGDWIAAAQSEIANLSGQLRDFWELHAQQSGWVIEDNPPPDLQKWYE